MIEITRPQIPDHEVLRVIGRGAYGEIWLARSLTGALRAVKVVYRSTFESERAFNREFLGMSAFEPISRAHDGFVDILHVGRVETFFFYIMELGDDHLSGQEIVLDDYVPKTLKTEIDRRRRLPAAECITLGCSLTDALRALHAHRLTHRDIKPANIIFVNGVPKLADIGLVAASGQRSFVGTEGYVPPEGPGTPQADVYSLGKVLYEISMGKDRLEFPAIATNLDEGGDKRELLRLNEILLRACANDPAKRYQSAGQMNDDLACVRAGRKRKRKRPWLVPAAVAFLLLAAVLLWFQVARQRPATIVKQTIRTDPPGALVLLGDMLRKSPATFEEVKPGTYPLHVMLAGYDPVDAEIRISPEKADLPLVQLHRSKGALEVVTQLPDAHFQLLNGATVVREGTAPAKIEGLPTGIYTLLARREDRESSARVEIRRGELTSQELVFASGSATITSDPAGAAISIDGKPKTSTPLNVILDTGPHRIFATIEGWPEEEQTVVVDRDHDTPVHFDFANGSVKITSAPGGATVLNREGVPLGQTPLLVEEVKAGEVSYELRLAGYKNVTVTGTVRTKEQAFLAARLERKSGNAPGDAWVNSLGMKFVPVGNVRFSIWETRVKDYDAFCTATGQTREKPDFPQTPNDPVVKVSWNDARAFCKWLTETELSQNFLDEGQSYRLPSDVEWSAAAGLADEGGSTPEERDGKNKGEFPWGKTWPPPAGAGNYADQSARRTRGPVIANYNDGFPQTAPVGTFAANRFGLFDLGGNVWEWIEEGYKGRPQKDWGVLRGGSWANSSRGELQSAYRNVVDRNERDVIYGFRCVLVSEPPPAN